MKKIALLYNPQSGDGKISSNLDTIIKYYQKFGYGAQLVRLDENVDLVESFKEMDVDHILISGGDGTVNVCLNAMVKSGRTIPFGILPTGTANDFSKFIGMPLNNIEEALRQILFLPPQEMDLPLVNDLAFINVLSLGFFTDISQKTAPDLKNAFGKLAYYLKSVEMIKDLKKINIKVISHDRILYEGDVFMIIILNGASTGSLKLTNESLANDGLLDIIIIKEAIIPDIIGLLKGEAIEKLGEGILYIKCDEFEIYGQEDIPTDIDGEKGPDLPLRVKCLNKKLKILGVKS